MKKFSFAILCALLGTSCCLSSCGDDDDKDNKDDNVECSATQACANADQYCSADSKCVDKLADDADCTDAKECKSGKCEGNKCVANADQPADKKDDGAACTNADECKSGKCEGNLCVAAEQPADKKDDGADCVEADECKSGKCEGGKCGDGEAEEKLDDGEDCESPEQCKSGKCEDGKCGDKSEEPVTEGQPCSDDNNCTISKNERCVDKICHTADSLVSKGECESGDAGYCFGNIKVSCEDGENWSQYVKDDCGDNICEEANGNPICKVKEVDPGECSNANVGAIVYACGGEVEGNGSNISIKRTCTKNGTKYEWVDVPTNCDMSNGYGCLAACPEDACSSIGVCKVDIGSDCSNDNYCKSGYCKDKKCATPEPSTDKKNDGEKCTKADECKSGKCESGKCGKTQANEKLDDGANCNKDEDCKSNYCHESKCEQKQAEPLENGAVCTDDKECKSGYCETDDDETRKCAEKPQDPPTPDGKACTDDKGCDSSKNERCVDKVCLTADKLDKKECSEAEAGYCFGNIRVFCNVQESASLYDTQDCKEAECNDNGGKPICKAKEVEDPSKCTEANVDAVAYSCGGDLNDDGSYTIAITKTCTKDGSEYKWVEKTDNCQNDDACWSNHASSKCIGTYPNDFENGKACTTNLNCKSDYCDTSSKKCADKPEN